MKPTDVYKRQIHITGPEPIPVGKGDRVTILSGAFRGFDAVVQTSSDKGRIKLLLEFADKPESSFKLVEIEQGAVAKAAVLR